ncbi:hypothetical protein BKA70DRAFT_594101 [Coprinopsis sp. MPI-PUGE-AT-0042]|nr:hypothetical protein BKA70DRAFT_594101 [Coprinopsis sp. MPI-PUGE-AT-0042]
MTIMTSSCIPATNGKATNFLANIWQQRSLTFRSSRPPTTGRQLTQSLQDTAYRVISTRLLPHSTHPPISRSYRRLRAPYAALSRPCFVTRPSLLPKSISVSKSASVSYSTFPFCLIPPFVPSSSPLENMHLHVLRPRARLRSTHPPTTLQGSHSTVAPHRTS